MIHRRSRRVAAVLISGALVAAACGGDDGDEPEAESTPTEVEAEPETTDADEPATSDEPETGGDDPPPSTAAPLEDADQITSEGEGSDDASLEPVPGGEITWGLTNDGTGFDTTGAVAPGSIRIISALNDSLAGLDIEGNWVPNLAQSIEPNDDYTVWTITTRPGVVFHDGEPVDGPAVAANLNAFKASPTAGFSFAPVTSITAVDDSTVEIVMSSPWAQFPQSLVSQAGWMVSPSTIGTNDTFIGTGPFMLESWTPGDGARIVKNPNYWRADEGLPYLDAVNFKFLPDQTVRRQAFDAGDLQGYLSPGDEDIVDFLEDDDVDVWIGTAGANEYLWLLNTTAPPFDDIRVRRAMAHAIDKQFIIDNFRSGLTTPANGPWNPSSKFYSENDYPQFDPAAAQALVDEYEAEVGPIEFELSIEPNPSVIEVAEVMMSFLADVGIEGSLKEIGQGQSAITALQDDYQAFSWFQFGAPDPDREYTFFHSSGGLLNWSNLVSADIDAGFDKGRVNVDEDIRREGYAQVLKALGDEVPMLWVDHLNGVEAVVTIPELHGIGVSLTLPDGSPALAMTDGAFFAWTGAWIEQ
jgi:peptide/nickel transport system substrate-binding protein